MDATHLLSRMYTTPAGLVAYDADGFLFVSGPERILAAHVAEVAVGPHPYAERTWCWGAYKAHLSPLVLEGTGLTAEVLSDWAEWCEDVVDAAVAEVAFAGRAPGSIDTDDVRDQMPSTWEVFSQDAELVAAVNAA